MKAFSCKFKNFCIIAELILENSGNTTKLSGIYFRSYFHAFLKGHINIKSICFISKSLKHLPELKWYSNSPRNYRLQKAIAFNIAIEEKIINSKFLPLIIYLQFTMNLSLFYWIRSLFFYTDIYSFKKTFLSWLFYLKSKFSIHFRLQHVRWSKR